MVGLVLQVTSDAGDAKYVTQSVFMVLSTVVGVAFNRRIVLFIVCLHLVV